jgi:hypothetical protein
MWWNCILIISCKISYMSLALQISRSWSGIIFALLVPCNCVYCCAVSRHLHSPWFQRLECAVVRLWHASNLSRQLPHAPPFFIHIELDILIIFGEECRPVLMMMMMIIIIVMIISHFLRALAKLEKNAYYIRVVVHPSGRLHQLGSHWTYFREIWYWRRYENLWRISGFG